MSVLSLFLKRAMFSGWCSCDRGGTCGTCNFRAGGGGGGGCWLREVGRAPVCSNLTLHGETQAET